MRCLNPTDQPLELKNGTAIGTYTGVEDEAVDMNGATLSSTGFGVWAYFPYSIDAQIELAFPLEDAVLAEKPDNAELFFRVGHSIKLDQLPLFQRDP